MSLPLPTPPFLRDQGCTFPSVCADSGHFVCLPDRHYLSAQVTGTARNRDSIAVPRWQGMLRVRREQAIRLSKIRTFSGPRQWRHHLPGDWRLSDPEPADAVPLRYELAWGGHWLDPKAKPPAQRYRVRSPSVTV